MCTGNIFNGLISPNRSHVLLFSVVELNESEPLAGIVFWERFVYAPFYYHYIMTEAVQVMRRMDGGTVQACDARGRG